MGRAGEQVRRQAGCVLHAICADVALPGPWTGALWYQGAGAV